MDMIFKMTKPSILLVTVFFAVSFGSLNLKECGKSRGCFRHPPGCKADHCEHIVSWRPVKNESMIEFELDVLISRHDERDHPWWWTAVGVSRNQLMNDTSVVDCILNGTGGNIMVQNSYNAKKGHENTVLEKKTVGLEAIEGSFVNRRLGCKFNRQIHVPGMEDQIFPLNESYFLLLPIGPAYSNGTKEKHFDNAITPVKISPHDVTLDIGAPTNTSLDISLDSCGEKKGCFRIPDKCHADNCTYIVTWINHAEDVEFELSAATGVTEWPWVAVGFSDDDKMPNTSVVACILNGSSHDVSVEVSYNPAHENVPLDDPHFGIVNGSLDGTFHDGKISCRFRRVKTMNGSLSESSKFFNLTQNYYFLLASGPTSETGIKQKHLSLPGVSPIKIDISHFQDLGGMTQIPLVQAHATLMVFAWVVALALGMFVARNMKNFGVNAQIHCCQHPLWFQMHRILIGITWILVIPALVCIFIHKNFSFDLIIDGSNFHPIFGFVTLFLAFINPIIGICRPQPDSPYRSFFYWIHFATGQLVHFASGITMYYGVLLEPASMVSWAKWVVLAFIIWRNVIEVSFTLVRKILFPEEAYIKMTEEFNEAHSSKLDVLTFWYLVVFTAGLGIIASCLIFCIFT